ncbi:MAG: MOSC domain-containing protein [Armatimonadota bacterium]
MTDCCCNKKADTASVVSVNISLSGIPKLPVEQAAVTFEIIEGDGRMHKRHRTPLRAVSLIDEEILQQFREEGYPVTPGLMGENLTVRGIHVQELPLGARLRFSGGVEIELTEVRKPCYLLDPIHPALKDAAVERCGYLAKVITEGVLHPGETITVELPAEISAT